jgi:hypothetical protein
MASVVVRHVCEYCGTAYSAPSDHPIIHCVQCFSCKQYVPLNAIYGKVEATGYCCRVCEAAEHLSKRLVFDMVLNLPQNRNR